MKLYDIIKKERPELNNEIIIPEQESYIIEEHYQTSNWTRKKKIIVSFCILFFLWLIWFIGNQFGFVKVIIKERHIPFSMNQTKITLTNESKAVSGDVPFQTVVVTDEVNREVFGTEILDSNQKAKGSVIFFNEYSKNTTTLNSGLVLIGDNNKKYVLNQTVKIPGFTLKNNQKIPGSTSSVPISAFDFGPDYNTNGTNLSVSSFTGSKRTQIYSRSVGAITGGQNDGFHKVADKDKDAVLSSLKSDLVERLKRQTRTQIPDDYVIFPDLQFVFISDKDINLFGPGIKFPVNVRGTLVTYIIKRDLLENAIAFNTLSDHSYSSVSIPDFGGISIEPISGAPMDPKEVPDTFDISVSGQGTIITEIPPIKIKDILAGQPTTSFENLVAHFSEIEQASFQTFPFWLRSFPINKDKIKLTIN